MYFPVFLLLLVTSAGAKLNGEGTICGRTNNRKFGEDKIVGGFDVGYYKYPWYAALTISDLVACGGSLIGSKTIVTAAHCYKEYLMNKSYKLEDIYNVTLGIYNKCIKEKTQRLFHVQKVYVHEKYKDNIPYYDIAVLTLKESTTGFEPICLPKSAITIRPNEGSVPGLGTLRYHGSVPCTLHESRLLIQSDAECRNMMNRTGNDGNKMIGAFCAGYLQGGIDTCQGDSGGPFQITDGYENYILLGVVSFGFHCANPGLLGIYTDVSKYVDWIQQKAGFNATMEGNNSTEAPVENETDETPTKPVKGSHHAHVWQHGFFRPVNIIIIQDRAKNNKKTHN